MVPLTAREKQVARLIADGMNNRQIAEKLGIAVNTVKKHRVQVFNKLEVTDATGLVRCLMLPLPTDEPEK